MNHTYQWNDELTGVGSLPLWHVTDDSSFSIETVAEVDGNIPYIIKVEELPDALKVYINDEKDLILMGGANMMADWNATLANADEITFLYGQIDDTDPNADSDSDL